jgi:sugar lactone lactonase YvrE
MKKNRSFAAGMLVMALAFGMALTACDVDTPNNDATINDDSTINDDNNDNGEGNPLPRSLKITGLPAGKRSIWVGINSGANQLIAASGWADIGDKTQVTVSLKEGNDLANAGTWTGSGRYYLFLDVYDTETYKIQYFYSEGAMIPSDMSSGVKKFDFMPDSSLITVDFSMFAEPKDTYAAYQITPAVSIGKNNLADGGPRSITVGDNGTMYIADSLNKKIIKIDQEGQLVSQWTSDSVGTLSRLYVRNSSVYAQDDKGWVYILDNSLNLLSRFDLSLQIGSNGAMGICVDSSLNIYAIDEDNGIVKYSADNDGSYKKDQQWTLTTSAIGPFDWGYGSNLVMDSFDNIYVPDYGNKRVIKIDTLGQTSRVIDGSLLFQAYIGFAINDTNMYILDSYNNSIHVYTINGTYIKTIGNGDLRGTVKMQYPSSIFYADGKLYVLDFNNFLQTFSNNSITVISVVQ